MTESGWIIALREHQNPATVDRLTSAQQNRRQAVIEPTPRPMGRLHAGMVKRPGFGSRNHTKVKLQPDALVTMFKRGVLVNEHLHAAAEIREIFAALTRHIGSKVANSAPRSWPPVKQGSPGRMPPKLMDLYQRRYKPWAADAGQRRMIIPGGRMTHLEVVISVIVEGEATVAMAERLQMPMQSGCRMFENILQHSLTRYWDI